MEDHEWWTIKYTYTTGDSFRTYDDEGELAIRWKNLDKAKLALKRIRELYAYEMKTDDRLSRETFLERDENIKKLTGESVYYNVCMMFELDNGEMQSESTPWRDYFGRLQSMRIEKVSDSPDDNDMVFNPSELMWGWWDDETT